MRWTFLKGTILFVAGILCLLAALAITGLGLALFLERRGMGVVFVFFGFLVFLALNLLSIGFYRMLRHLYRSISRTDPASDRAIRGTPFYLIGYLGGVMAMATLIFFTSLPFLTNNQTGFDKVIWGIVPAWFVVLGSILAFFIGLVMMLTDIYDRYGEIERRRVSERERFELEDEKPAQSQPILLSDYPEAIEPSSRQ